MCKTVLLSSNYDVMVYDMKHKKESKEAMSAVCAELAKPRVARSARIEELRLDATRIAERQVPAWAEPLTRSYCPEFETNLRRH